MIDYTDLIAKLRSAALSSTLWEAADALTLLSQRVSELEAQLAGRPREAIASQKEGGE